MRYTLTNPPKTGARVMLNNDFDDGPFTVESFSGEFVHFSDRHYEWLLYETEDRSGCRDATAAELESA